MPLHISHNQIMLMNFSGIYSAIVTPFNDAGTEISIKRMQQYCNFLLEQPIDGLFAFGTTGEWPLLTGEERIIGMEAVLSIVEHKIPVIVHVGAYTTEQAIHLSRCAEKSGANAVSVICPPFYPLDDQALLEHFVAIAKAIPETPVFIYNLPSFTGNDVLPELLLKIAKNATNVIGVKYSGDNLMRFRKYRRTMGKDFLIFGGDDGMILPYLHEEANGFVSGNAAAVPEVVCRLYREFRQGKFKKASAMQEALDEFIRVRDSTSVLSTFKAILRIRGIPVGDVRMPLKRLSTKGIQELKKKLLLLTERGLVQME